MSAGINSENFESHYFRFNDRQAGISLVYSDAENRFYYNVYCLEMTLLKEISSVEVEFLDDAIDLCNQEFGSWELASFAPESSGCGSCAAK